MTDSKERHRENTIWQRRFWEHQVRDDEDLHRHLDYIHYNPVKHGLVTNPDQRQLLIPINDNYFSRCLTE